MRIGIKISPLTVLRAGIPNYILNLLNAFSEMDDNNEFVLYTNRPIDTGLDLPDRFRVVRVSFPSPHLQLWYQIGLPRQMIKDGIQLFHDPVYPLPFVLPVPGVITVHDLSNYTNPGVHKFSSALSGKLFPMHLRKTRQIITDSRFSASELERIFPWTAPKINVIHLGVSERFKPVTSRAELEAVAEQHGLPGRFMLFLGTLEPRKNISRLLEAFALSCSEMPHHLVITGGLGWKYEKLLQLISDHPNRDRILLTGYVDDQQLPALLSMAEFLVYPSVLEGFGFPILEAMSCGTPVITSNVSSMPEIAGNAALLIDPLSIRSIADGISKLATDEFLRRELAVSGLERIKEFSWKKTALETMKVYRKALE